MQRLLGVCCCLLALGLATQAAEKAPKEVEQSAALQKDAAATLRKIRSANPEERGNKKKKKTSKRKSKQGKGKKANKKRKNTLKQRREKKKGRKNSPKKKNQGKKKKVG